jgi:signal peptidase I
VTSQEPADSPAVGPVGPVGDAGLGAAPDTVANSPASAGNASTGSTSFWREFPVLIVVALAIALVIKTFVIQAFFIPSGSMQNTLEIGDKVLVNKVVYHFRPIRPGDIVVFDGARSWDAPVTGPASSDPVARLYDDTVLKLLRSVGGLFGTAPGQTDYIKRVIGVPGDHVACCNARGQVTVNGVALHEGGYLYPGNVAGDAPLGESGHFKITVPAGRIWVLGDHRAISDDSRGHADDPGDGTVPESKVIGRAFMIVWPPSRWRILPVPPTFERPGITGRAALAGPALPLAGGLAGALPVTALLRRRRVRERPVRGAAAGRRAAGRPAGASSPFAAVTVIRPPVPGQTFDQSLAAGVVDPGPRR